MTIARNLCVAVMYTDVRGGTVLRDKQVKRAARRLCGRAMPCARMRKLASVSPRTLQLQAVYVDMRIGLRALWPPSPSSAGRVGLALLLRASRVLHLVFRCVDLCNCKEHGGTCLAVHRLGGGECHSDGTIR